MNKERSKYLTNNQNTNIFRVTSPANEKIFKKEMNTSLSNSINYNTDTIEHVLFGEDSTYFIENIKNVKLRPINLKKTNNVTFFALPSAVNHNRNYLNFNSNNNNSQRYNKVSLSSNFNENDKNDLFMENEKTNVDNRQQLHGILKSKNNFIPCFSRFWSELQQLKNKDPTKLKSNHLSFTYFS